MTNMTEAEREKAGAELENHALLAVTEAQAGERLDAAVAAPTPDSELPQ